MVRASHLQRIFVLLSLLFFVQCARLDHKKSVRIAGKEQPFPSWRGWGGREPKPTEPPCVEETLTHRPVKILVTRHGLSCANLIDKFSKGWVAQKMHALMPDPLLSAAGDLMTSNAAADVSKWLASHPEMKLDAVLASHLARAWQTAALQYPGFEVHGAPFISESGVGLDNTARPFHEQEAAVKGAVPDFNIELKWLRRHGQSTSGNWGKFKNFLATEYLPELAPKIAKSNTEPMVLAAVTHSNFMMEGEIKKKCQSQYPVDSKSRKKKANNNQVVLIHYKWQKRECGTPDNRTATYELVDDWIIGRNGRLSCEGVAIGTSIYDHNGKTIPLCRKDVGEQCQREFQAANAWVVPTLEQAMQELDEEYMRKKSELADAKMRAMELAVDVETAQGDPSQVTPSRARQALAKNQKKMDKLSGEMPMIEAQYLHTGSKKCWLGGKPDYTTSTFHV